MAGVVIDDEAELFRFTCPTCGNVAEKDMDAEIRGLLRAAKVPTIEEIVESSMLVLSDDGAIWKAMPE